MLCSDVSMLVIMVLFFYRGMRDDVRAVGGFGRGAIYQV